MSSSFLPHSSQRLVDRDFVEGRFALLLLDDAHRFGDVFLERLAHPLVERRRSTCASGYSRFGFAGFLRELVDRGDDLLDLSVRELDGAEEIFLGDLVAAAFDHHDGVGRAGDDDVHAAGFVLRKRGIADVLAVSHRGRRARRRRSCRTGMSETASAAPAAHTASTSASSSRIDRQHRRDDLHVVAEAVGEQRTDRPVDLARAEHGVLGRTAFALDVAARNLSGGVHFLFEFAGEGEEIDAFARFLRGGDGGEDDVGVAIADETRSRWLASQVRRSR